jgi:hypothetical protein
MTFLTRSISPGPDDAVHALLSLEEESALSAALAALEPEEAALAVERAPTLEDRGRLLRALSSERRGEVLDRLHPGFVGALIQNREEENRALLGDLSREQFTRLLRYCSPEQAFYWLALATSFPHPRANMLPLLVPVEELAAAMMSVPDFALHCQEVGDYSVGDLQIEQDDFLDVASATVTVFGPDGRVVEEFPILEDGPVRDPRLRRLLHTLEHHPEQYTAVVTVIGIEGSLEELPLRDPRLRRLLHRLLDYDLEQYTAILNLFGPEGVLKEFPVRDRRLRRLLQTILDQEPDRYIALVQAALQLSDYGGNHPEERALLSERPLLLDGLLSIEEERARAGVASSVGQTGGPQPEGLRVDPEPLSAGPEQAAASPSNVDPEGGDRMTFITRSASMDHGDPIHALLSLEESEAFNAAVNAMEPEEVALAIGRAPTLEQRSRLVWALTPERRAEALDKLHPGFVGALIQNQEEENKRLLGDLSREQFTRLLRYCDPERAYYWLMLATSFEDARARMLPLLVPIRELAAALLTQPEFETHCERIGDYGIENLGLDLAQQFADTLEGFQDLAYAIVTVFGPEGMLREFPIKDPRLRRLLQTILDQSPEHYAQLIHTALALSDYAGNHSEEREVLQEEPILLEELLTLEEERSRAGLIAPEKPGGRPAAADVRGVPSLPVRQSAELMRAAASALPAQRQSELSQELQLLYMQEAAYAGGSFLQADLEQAAGRVQSYVQLGLAGLADGDREQAARLLGEQRLRTLMESGARQVERLRQVALRLLPWHEVLDKRQRRLLEGLEHPDMGVEEDGRPVLRLRAVKRRAPVEVMDLEAVRVELEGISAWISLVRAVGKARIARRMAVPAPSDAGGSAPAAGEAAGSPERRAPEAAEVARALVVAAILYRHWDPALAEPADIDRFRQTYLDPATGRFNEAAFRALAEAIRALAAERNLAPDALQEIARLLARAMDELARSVPAAGQQPAS